MSKTIQQVDVELSENGNIAEKPSWNFSPARPSVDFVERINSPSDDKQCWTCTEIERDCCVKCLAGSSLRILNTADKLPDCSRQDSLIFLWSPWLPKPSPREKYIWMILYPRILLDRPNPGPQAGLQADLEKMIFSRFPIFCPKLQQHIFTTSPSSVFLKRGKLEFP